MGSFYPVAGSGGSGSGGVNFDVALPNIGDWLGKVLNPNGGLKVLLTNAYDSAELELKRNLAAYLQGSASVIRRNTALNFFDAVWKQLYDFSLRNGQQGMISWNERQRISQGGKWPWPEWYRDPIANDQRLGTVSQGAGEALGAVDSALEDLTGQSFGTWGTIAVLGVLAFIAWRAFK